VFKEEVKAKDAEADALAAKAIAAEIVAKESAEKAKKLKELQKLQQPDSDMNIKSHTDSTQLPDYTYIPEYVFVGNERRVLKDSNMAYRWGRYSGKADGQSRLPIHQVRGWRPVFYDPKFTDTGLFQKSIEGWVLNGDTMLFQISKDGLRRLAEEKQRRFELMTRAAEEGFAGEGERLGVETFKEDPKTGRQERH
jgi:hypothetical protein